MNMFALIRQHPLLFADLKHLGIPTIKIRSLADEVSQQLGGDQAPNLSLVLNSLNSEQFVAATDVSLLADRTGLAPSTVQSCVLLMAPWVGRFQLTPQTGLGF